MALGAAEIKDPGQRAPYDWISYANLLQPIAAFEERLASAPSFAVLKSRYQGSERRNKLTHEAGLRAAGLQRLVREHPVYPNLLGLSTDLV
ncbi:MAG: hypothetical protein ACXVBB_16795, partial [Isosphaeraceae bacterium]